jgi:hypothetical protein
MLDTELYCEVMIKMRLKGWGAHLKAVIYGAGARVEDQVARLEFI